MANPVANIDFLYELGELRHIKRNYHYAPHTISVAEHTLRVTYIALILAKQSGANIEKTLQIALMHDIAEARTGDATPWQKLYVQINEHAAVQDMLHGTDLETLAEYGAEYEKRESLEAQIVKDADLIDTELEMREMRELGSTCLEFFERIGVRDQVETRLRTPAGKALMRAARARNPFDRIEERNSTHKTKQYGT